MRMMSTTGVMKKRNIPNATIAEKATALSPRFSQSVMSHW